MTSQMISKDQVHISIFKLEFTPWLKFFPSKKTFFTSTSSSSKNFHYIRKFLHGNLVRYMLWAWANLAIPEAPAINKSSVWTRGIWVVLQCLHRNKNVTKDGCKKIAMTYCYRTSRRTSRIPALFWRAGVQVLVRLSWLKCFVVFISPSRQIPG
jgi:hypothetical protein